MEKLKYYIEYPHAESWRMQDWKTHIPLCLGLNLSWKKYEFDLCPEKGYYPKGEKRGHHIFSFTIGVLYFWLHLTIYKPKKP